MLGRKPDYIIRHAVKGMMPKTRLTEAQMKKLRIYAGDQHDMQSQAPVPVNI
jgi:large subunit ribosomal protein L13